MSSPLRNALRDSMIVPPQNDGTGNVTSSFCCAPDFPGFDGHFPDNPILPAVVQILMGAITTGISSPEIPTVSRAKFTRLVKPSETIDVACELTETDDGLSALVRLSVEDETASTFRLVIASEAQHD